MELDTELYYFR